MRSSLRRPSVFVVLPFALGLFTVAGKATLVDVPKLIWAVAMILVFVFALMGFVTVRVAYRWKRELFLPGATNLDRLERQDQLDHTG